MPKIKVDTTGVIELRGTIVSTRSQASDAISYIAQARNGIDMNTAASESVNNRINRLYARMQAQQTKLSQYETALARVNEQFLSADRTIANQARDVHYLLDRIIETPYQTRRNTLEIDAEISDILNLILSFDRDGSIMECLFKLLTGGGAANVLFNIIRNTAEPSFEDQISSVTTPDFNKKQDIDDETGKWVDQVLSSLKALLSFNSKIDSLEGTLGFSGITKEIIAYLQSLFAFFSEDNMSHWIIGKISSDLVDKSISLEKKFYDFLEKYHDGEGAVFSLENKTKAQGIQIFASIIGLAGSYCGAIEEIRKGDNNGIAGIIGDVLGAQENLADIGKDVYELLTISKESDPSWFSPADIYVAIAKGYIAAVAQGFESVDTYSADGDWTVGDTGATGIDVAMEGLYGITHSLTGGLDDLVFGSIDALLGGDGTDNMSYAEKAAEGYKILASDIGEGIGKWWLSITT